MAEMRASEPTTYPSKPRRRAASPLALCLVVLFLTGCKPEKAEHSSLLPVRVREVKLTSETPEFTLTGEISAQVQSNLSFRIGGRIIERNVDVGAHLEPGAVLARLDPKVQEADVAGADAAVQAAEARLRQTASIFERQKALLAQGFTTRRDHDQADQEQRSAQAMLDSARAQLATARDQLAQTVLVAPSPGIVTARNVEVGQVVQPSQPVFALAQDGPRDAVVYVQEAFLTSSFSDLVDIASVSDPRIKARGEIRETAPTLGPTGTVRVKIGIPQAPPEMVLGSAVQVTARARARQIVLLPWSTLYSDGGRPAVWVVDPQSRTVGLRRIEIESYKNSDLVVREGLRPGEIVVTSGTHLLRPGQQVAFAEVRS